jgi:DNA-binding transcriptional LysR family regulator
MLRQAVGACLADRYRRGCVVYLPCAGDLLVAGDLHGNRINFVRLLSIADLAHNPDRHLVLQEAVHGGPSSAQGGCLSYILFEALAALKARYPDRVHILIGNHDMAEHMEQIIFKDGVVLNRAFDQGMAEAYGDRREEVRVWYRKLIESLLVACRTEHGLFISHSTPDGGSLPTFDLGLFEHPRLSDDLERGSSLYTLTWGRDYRPETADGFAQLVGAEVFLVSHTPTPLGYEVPNHRHVIIQSYDDAGGYVLLPLDRPATQADVVASIHQVLTGRHPDDTVTVERSDLGLQAAGSGCGEPPEGAG